MGTYNVVLKTPEGQVVSTFREQGNSLNEVQTKVHFKAVNIGQMSYVAQIDPVGQSVPPEAMSGLFDASLGLFACLFALVIADYKLKKWLKS